MARIAVSPSAGENYGTFVIPTGGATILGVVLNREIPSGTYTSPSVGSPTIPAQEGVKVRPTNVTAVIGTTANQDPDYIVLHNGPAGGFNQTAHLDAGTYRANAVVGAIITSG